MEEELTVDTDFSQLIAQLRANVGMSQAEACRRSGVSADTWSRLESATHKSEPTLRRALMMLRGVGMKISLTLDNEQGS